LFTNLLDPLVEGGKFGSWRSCYGFFNLDNFPTDEQESEEDEEADQQQEDAIDEDELLDSDEMEGGLDEENESNEENELNQETNDSNSVSGKIPFSAFTYKGNKTLHFVSSDHDPLETMPHRETKQTKRGERSVRVNAPTVRVDYCANIGFTDCVNAEIMRNYFPHKILRWKTALLVWLLRALVQDARVFYNFGRDPLTTVDFLRELMLALGPTTLGGEHELIPVSIDASNVIEEFMKNAFILINTKICPWPSSKEHFGSYLVNLNKIIYFSYSILDAEFNDTKHSSFYSLIILYFNKNKQHNSINRKFRTFQGALSRLQGVSPYNDIFSRKN